MSQQCEWEEVLGRPELAGLVMQAARSGSGDEAEQGEQAEQATQAAHALCLTSAACRQAVLGAVERAAAPGAWAREQAAVLGAMTALASLRLTVDDRGVDPAQLPRLPRLTRLECGLLPGARAAAAWPGLGSLRQLALVVGAVSLPPALLQLPHLTCLQASTCHRLGRAAAHRAAHAPTRARDHIPRRRQRRRRV
jgi:hypothetical protein